jgi:hypothetical protein
MHGIYISSLEHGLSTTQGARVKDTPGSCGGSCPRMDRISV